MKRSVKQIIIVLTVLLLIGSSVFLINRLLKTDPTCFDGIKNGEEEGVDCGTACEKACKTETPKADKIVTKSFEIIRGGNNKCDLVAVINNPNNSLAGQKIPYSFSWGDKTIKKDEFYIYPGEERYLAEYNLVCQDDFVPELKIGDAKEWSFFRSFTKPDLQISDFKLNYLDSPYEFAEVRGRIINRSPFDLKTVEIFSIVKDVNQAIIAINQTTVNSILAGQTRDFRIFWTHSFEKGGVPSFYVTSNLFDSQNFIKNQETDSTKQREVKNEEEIVW